MININIYYGFLLLALIYPKLVKIDDIFNLLNQSFFVCLAWGVLEKNNTQLMIRSYVVHK